MAAVDPSFSSQSLQVFQALSSQQQYTLSQALLTRIRGEAERAVQTLSSIANESTYPRLTLLLMMFALKRPDIGYHAGMSYILTPLLALYPNDADAFVLFTYLIERVFPEDFFSPGNRCLSAHVEYRAFTLQAESLRPKLLKSLKAIYNSTNAHEKSQESDFSPFVTTMKRLAEGWFCSLFATSLNYYDWLRVGDVIMLHGFEGVQKVAAGLLSAWERPLINAIKNETKRLEMGSSVDALINAGNTARLRLMRHFGRLPIEAILRKALTKPTYFVQSRASLLEAASVVEKNYLERLVRLRQTRSMVKKQRFGVDFQYGMATIKKTFTGLEATREAFMQVMVQNYLWSQAAALNLFTTLDQRGGNLIAMSHLKAALAVCRCEDNIESCLSLLFTTFSGSAKAMLEAPDVIDLISTLEQMLDIRASSFQSQSHSLFQRLQALGGRCTVQTFCKLVTGDPGPAQVIELLKGVLDETFVPSGELRLVIDFEREGSFEEIHSPVKLPGSSEPSDCELSPTLPDDSLSQISLPGEDSCEEAPIVFEQEIAIAEPKVPVFTSSPQPVPIKSNSRQKCVRLCSLEECTLC